MPNIMVINYSFTGQANYTVNKILDFLIVPVIMVETYILENEKISQKSLKYAIFSSYIVLFLLNLFLLIANL